MRRWGGAFALGAGVTVAAMAFGSRPLGVAGVGLLLAAGLTSVWAGLVRTPVAVVVNVDPAVALEGDRVTIAIEVRRSSRAPVGSAFVHGTVGRLGAREWRLRGHGRTASAKVELGALPRGCFPLVDSRLVLGDFLGLESVTPHATFSPATVIVYPRLVALDGLFSDAGRAGGDGRRLLLRRVAGFDFHSVREYEQGESLRRVHWPRARAVGS